MIDWTKEAIEAAHFAYPVPTRMDGKLGQDDIEAMTTRNNAVARSKGGE